MKKTDQEIEKMLLNDLEETIVMGWADTSEKSLLLELIRERQVKNNIVLPDVSGQSELLFAFIAEVKKEFAGQNWDYLNFIAERVLKANNSH